MNTTAQILTRVIGSIPTTGLVLTMSRCMEVYTCRPMLTIPEVSDQIPMEYQYPWAA